MERKNKHIREDKAIKKEEKIINKKDKKMKKKHPKLRLAIKIILILFLVTIIAGIATVVAIFKTDKWAITKEQLLNEAGATIYDINGNEIATLTGDEINKKIALTEMGKVPEAFISIEDERFYEHNGIDLTRTLHAIVKYILSAGKTSFGGSTITQQLVKITMKDDSRSGIAGVERKIREWSRAVQVEKMLTKDQIIERYLNRIYLGSSSGLEVRGVEAAANYYFNKVAKDLSIAQSAFIAGINHSPAYYNPFTSTKDISEKIKDRTLTVLGKMHELKKISDDEYNQAVEETKNGLKFEQGKVSNGKGDLSYHTAAAINQIANELSDKNDISYNEARELLVNSGYKIHTTVDNNVQKNMETTFQNDKYIYKGSYAKDPNDRYGQSAMVIIDPSTGYVVGEVGGLGSDQNTLGLNRGISKRQGGSAFKPLVTIAPGLENKVITASTLFYDVKTTFGSNYTVSNDGNSYYGIANMRTILTHSCNVPEIKLLSIMGTNKAQDFLSQINIKMDAASAGLSMALGTVDISPVQMAAGYAMLANGGTYITPTFYTKVEDKDGNTIIESKQDKKRVMSEANAYIEASLLQGPVKSGTASSFRNYLGSMDVAGKTGTTDGAIDRWFCGFTPYYAAACWYGNDNNNASFYNSNYGGNNPAGTLWFNTMKLVHSELEVKKFARPDDIVEVTVCKASGKKATDKCTDTYTEIFAKDNIPGDCDAHTSTVKVCKESGKLATEFCTDTEERNVGYVIETEKNASWSPRQDESSVPTEKCNIHTQAQKFDVPNVIGKSQASATKALEDAGFKVKIEKDNDKTKAKGVVLKQSETKAPKGAEIIISINQYDGSSNTTDDDPKNNTTGNTNTTEPPAKNETTGNKTEENKTAGE